MKYAHSFALPIVASVAFVLAIPLDAHGWSGFFDHPNAGWYLFKGPIVLPRFGVTPTTALEHLEYQHVGAGYGGFAGGYPTMALGYGPYPNWGYGVPQGGIPLRRRTPVPAPPPLPEPCAQFTIAVPANATVWLEGVATRQTGPVRRFVTPPLDPSESYGYTVRACWHDGERWVEQSKEIAVRAGDNVGITFPLGE